MNATAYHFERLLRDALEGFDGAQISAHGAYISIPIFALHTEVTGFYRINGHLEHSIPVKPFSGSRHLNIPFPGALDALFDVADMSGNFCSNHSLSYIGNIG